MLGPCYPVAQAVLGAAARPFCHLARHWAGHGVRHGAHHLSVHHAALPHIAAPHAAEPAIMCAKMPGLLPAGPLPAAAAGPASSGALVGPGSGLTGSSYAAGAGGGVGAGSGTAFAGASASATAVGGGVFGGSGLAGAALPLAAAVLIAAGLVTGVMAKPNQSPLPEQLAFQPAAMASMAPLVMPSPTSTVFSPVSPVTAVPGAPIMPAVTSQPGMTIPELPEQMPGMLAPSTGASIGTGSEAIPEPASLDLLGFCVLGIVAAREWGRRTAAGTHIYLRRAAARQAGKQSPITSARKVRSGP